MKNRILEKPRPIQTISKFQIEQAYAHDKEHHQKRINFIGTGKYALDALDKKRARRIPRIWHEAIDSNSKRGDANAKP